MLSSQGCRLSQRVETPAIVSNNEWRGFWISYDYASGHLQVGREGEPAFMSITDPTPIDVKYLGYSSWVGNTAQFRFCNY